jgi:CBS domain containing-hemolysin-like protein
MMLTAIPAVLLGTMLGWMWAMLYHLDGPRRQPAITLLGLLISVLTSGFVVLVAQEFASSHMRQIGLARWAWTTNLMALMIPKIVLVSWLTAAMYRRRRESRHRVLLARMAEARRRNLKPDVVDTPITPGQSSLG